MSALALGAFFVKAGKWALGLLQALLSFVVKYPLQAALVVLVLLLAVVWWRSHARIEALEGKLHEAAEQITKDAARIRERTKERDDAIGHIATARATVQAFSNELAKRDREDAARQKQAQNEAQKAMAARRDAEAVATHAIAQLEQAARRKPSCAQLLAMDVAKECGL